MAIGPDRQTMTYARTADADLDVGLRKYMLGIYNYMALGLAVSAIVALAVASSAEATAAIHGTPLKWVVMFAPLGIILWMSFGARGMSVSLMKGLYWALTVTMGASLSYILMIYTGESVVRVFFITAAAFAGLSLWGYTTKRSLSGMGTFLVMGLIGLIIASVVNIFLASSMLQFIISGAGVLIFSGLIAFDTQRLKNEYFEAMPGDVAAKSSIMGAVSLYINFINLFQFLLAFLGDRE